MKKLLILITLFLLYSVNCFSAPLVSNTSGSISHNQIVTINGSGFGTKSPVAPLLYDSVDGMYETISQNAVVPTGGSNPWNSSGGSDMYNPTFNLNNPRGKNIAKYNNSLSPSSAKNAVLGGKVWEECAGKKLYISYWMYPYTSVDSPSYSNKLMRLTNDGGYALGDKSTVVWGYNGQQIIAHSIVENYVGVVWLDYGDVGAWNRLEVVVDNSTNPKPTVAGYTNNTFRGSFTSSASISDIKGIYTIGADWSNDQNNPVPTIDWGEIYVDNTTARVEICNNSTKATSTHCEIQIPQNVWSTSQIEIKLNQGSFADGASAYLYVVDSNNEISNGIPITFGTTQSDITAPVISNITPSGTLAAGTTSTQLSFITDESATCRISQSSSTGYDGATNLTVTGGTSHNITVSGLVNGVSYTRYIWCKDLSNNISNYTMISWMIANIGVTNNVKIKASGKFSFK